MVPHSRSPSVPRKTLRSPRTTPEKTTKVSRSDSEIRHLRERLAALDKVLTTLQTQVCVLTYLFLCVFVCVCICTFVQIHYITASLSCTRTRRASVTMCFPFFPSWGSVYPGLVQWSVFVHVGLQASHLCNSGWLGRCIWLSCDTARWTKPRWRV